MTELSFLVELFPFNNYRQVCWRRAVTELCKKVALQECNLLDSAAFSCLFEMLLQKKKVNTLDLPDILGHDLQVMLLVNILIVTLPKSLILCH